jgi:small-conductance mechanosensitive channel
MNYPVFADLQQSTNSIWSDVTLFGPTIVTALLILLLGWIIAGLLKGVTIKLFRTLKVNEALDAAGVDELTKRAGYPLKAGVFVGTLVKWFVISIFFVVALDMLGLDQATFFIRDVVLNFLPNVIVAVLILVFAMIIAKIAGEAVTAAVRTSGTENPELFGKFVYYAIMVSAVLAALSQVSIADEMIETLFMGMVFALSLALGLAFGLGGKDTAARFLEGVTKKGGHHQHD